jgi:ABC-type glycerol-3-phosphate transport system substrate-binding protein
MRHRLQPARLGVAVPLILLVLAGCGGSDESADEGTPASGAKPAELSGKLTVVSNWTGSEGEAFQAVIEGFKQDAPGVRVEINQVPFDQTQAQLAQQFAAGSPPDVAVALPGIVRQFSGQGLLLNLDDLWDEWLSDGSYTQAVRDIAQGADDHTDAILFKGNVNALIWYTPAQLKQLGIGVPKTWDEFTAALDKVKADGIQPFAVGGKDGWPLTQWTDPLILRVAGADAFNQLARGEIGWDDPRIVKSFEVFADMITNYWPDDALSTSFVDATCARVDGKAAFQNQGAFINLVAPGECKKSLKPGKDFTFFEMPKYDESAPDARFVSGDLFMGAKDSDNPDAAVALLRYLGSAEAQEIWAGRGGFVAPNAKVPDSVYPNVNDRKAAALWPKAADTAAGYDLDDWIGGEIQTKYKEALEQFVREPDVSRFIDTMVKLDTRSSEG